MHGEWNSSGKVSIRAIAGPMGHSVEDLAFVMRLWMGEKLWKEYPYISPIPFNDKVYRGEMQAMRHKSGKLRIGYFEDDGWFSPCETARRAVQCARASLEQQEEYELVPFDEIKLFSWKVVALFFGILGAEGNMAGFMAGLEGEPLLSIYKSVKSMSDIPASVRPWVCFFLRQFGEQRKAHVFWEGRKKDVIGLQHYEAKLKQFRSEFARMWRTCGLDALIFPSTALPAFRHEGSKDLLVSLSYTFMANVLDYPSGVVPVTTVHDGECEYKSPFNDSWSTCAKESLKGSEGLPMGVQVMSKPFDDELCLRIMKDLEKSVSPGFRAERDKHFKKAVKNGSAFHPAYM